MEYMSNKPRSEDVSFSSMHDLRNKKAQNKSLYWKCVNIYEVGSDGQTVI